MNLAMLYPVATFLLVLGAMALVALAGLEWAALHRLRDDSPSTQVMECLATLGKGQKLVSMGVPLLLLSGFYLAWASQAWTAPWVIAGIVAMVLIGSLGGGVTGRHVGMLLASNGANLATHLRVLRLAFAMRVAVLVAAIFVMSLKPGAVTSIVALPLALLVGWVLGRGHPASQVAGAS